MIAFEHAARAIRLLQSQARLVSCLIVISWLAFAQPGMSYSWLVDPDVHARIDAEPHPPHEHPVILGLTVPGLTLANPFGEAFYGVLLSPAQRLALLDRRIEMAVIAQSITPEPPDQPPRPAA